jgi:hypothetical protein
MGTRLSSVAILALLAGGCGSGSSHSASAKADGVALVTVRPATTASLTASSIPGCAWCTTAFGADFTVESERALADVNLWLDGWSGTKRCLYAQHDSPADGFALAAGQPARVGFHQASVECAPPFEVDRVDVRVRSGDALVLEGSWPVRLAFEE